MNRAAIDTSNITGLVLCGGAGSRLGGMDKGLMPFHGRPLVDIAIDKIRPQVATLMISANRNIRDYETRGHAVLKDPDFNDQGPNYEGPLAGILAGLRSAATEWLLVVPCDCPMFPQDILASLISAAGQNGRGAFVDRHPAFAVISRQSQHSLETFLQHGHRKLGDWLREIQAQAIATDQDDSFKNLNTPQDFPQP